MRAYRSPTRLFAFGLLGLLLILASVDVMFAHWVSTEAENTDGVLTTRGKAQQRGDIIWGAVMLGTGTLLFAGAVVELVRRQSQCEIAADGIEIPMGRHGEDVTVPWSIIREVRGELVRDGFDGSNREQLVIEVMDTSGLPAEPLGAVWSGNDLQVDAQNWTKGVGEIALAAQGALGHYRRVDEIKHMEPPSLTWQTSVATGSDVEVQTAAGGEVDLERADVATVAVDRDDEPVSDDITGTAEPDGLQAPASTLGDDVPDDGGGGEHPVDPSGSEEETQ